MNKYIMTLVIASSITSFSVAADISVGRADITLPGEKWRVYTVPDEVSPFGGERSGQIKSERKVFVKESVSGAVAAIVAVSGSSGGLGVAGSLRYSPKCSSYEGWYLQGNEGFNRPFAECWGVLESKYSAISVMENWVPELTTLLNKENLRLPNGGYALFSNYRNANGTFLMVKMLIAPGFSMPDAKAVEAIPNGVDVNSVQYGHQLSNAVRASVTSWSGRLTLPVFDFAKQ